MYTQYREAGLTPKEVADMLGCSAWTVRELAKRKALPHYKVGSRYLFTRASIEKWVTRQEKQSQGGEFDGIG